MESMIYEQQAHEQGFALVCGVDEAGAGPLMGPLYAAAVILPEQFDLGKYVKTIFDMYNGRTETVQLRFDRALINVVMDRFGADAHIRPDGDRIAVTAPVEVGPTFYGWLFQFGGQAELLAPDHVRRDFTEHCRQALDRYRGDDAPNS